jgi:hypothetical protein
MTTESNNTFVIYPNSTITIINIALLDETKAPAKKH